MPFEITMTNIKIAKVYQLTDHEDAVFDAFYLGNEANRYEGVLEMTYPSDLVSGTVKLVFRLNSEPSEFTPNPRILATAHVKLSDIGDVLASLQDITTLARI